MKVLFVWFNFDSPVGFSHGIALLSRELKEAGHDVDVLHISERMGLPWDSLLIRGELARRTPHVLGLSFGTNHAGAARETAAMAREVLPGCFIICGGIHATINPEEVIAWPGVDAIAVGESDGGRLVDVLEGLRSGSGPRQAPGFWFRRGEGVVRAPIAPPVDLCAVPRKADLHLFDYRRIFEGMRGYAEVTSGRGCRFRCTYCHNDPLRKRYVSELAVDASSPLSYVRKRTVDDVIEELGEYVRIYGDVIKVFSFTDDMFIVDKDWFFEFARRYREKFSMPLVFNSTAPAIDREIAQACAEAGTYMVRIGVESGSPRIQREILRRPVTNAQIHRAVNLLQEAGVNVMTYNMLAIPGETMRDVWATFRFAAALRSDAVRFSVFWPYPGTVLYRYCLERGLLGGEVINRGNYLSRSPLRWRPARARFYERVQAVQDAALNMFLDTPFAGDFRRMVREAAALGSREWAEGGASRLAEASRGLADRALGAGCGVYKAPFPERPDILVLDGPDRKRPLINV